MSFLLVEKTTNDLACERVMFSTSKLPGVSASTDPPSAGIEYKCIHPSFSEGNSKRSPATQCQKSAMFCGYESLSWSPECQICLASPVRASATKMAHG